ncbi:hypothetical protein DVA86_30620 [Streptomyces armeniacus]|uniref:Uncharacterized protein n=1 Tax=Streptomyces armeniacus TaxID=83291 RepID=A0A345XXC8_9ACTN|nr:hypothetical protein DVA86_30620 [Streptomyces armeniacus]
MMPTDSRRTRAALLPGWTPEGRGPRACAAPVPGRAVGQDGPDYRGALAKKLVITVTAGADAPERCAPASPVAAAPAAPARPRAPRPNAPPRRLRRLRRTPRPAAGGGR